MVGRSSQSAGFLSSGSSISGKRRYLSLATGNALIRRPLTLWRVDGWVKIFQERTSLLLFLVVDADLEFVVWVNNQGVQVGLLVFYTGERGLEVLFFPLASFGVL